MTQMTAATATATNVRDLPRASSSGCCGCWTSPSLTYESPSVCQVMVTGAPIETARAGCSTRRRAALYHMGYLKDSLYAQNSSTRHDHTVATMTTAP